MARRLRRLCRPLVWGQACAIGLAVLLGCSAVGPAARPSPSAVRSVVSGSDRGAALAPGGPTPRMTRADPLRLVVLGDSIAVAASGCDNCLGFDRQYAAYLRTVTGRQVILDNLAVARGGITGLQLALTSDDREARVAMADIVVVGVGFDDGPPWRLAGSCPAAPVRAIAEWAAGTLAGPPDCFSRTMTRYAAELDRLYATVARLAAGRPQVRVALGVYSPYIGNPDILARSAPPVERADVRSIAAAGMREWNGMECTTARRHGFVCADIWRAFNGDEWREQLRYLYGRDGLHPSATGQLEITQRLAAIDVTAVW